MGLLLRFAFRGRPQPGQEGDWDRLLNQVSSFGRRFGGFGGRGGGAGGGFPYVRFFFVVLLVAALLWLASGFYVVNPGFAGVLRTWGVVTSEVAPGVGWRFPTPVQQVDIISIQQLRSMEVGFRTTSTEPVRVQPNAIEARMITGDENLVDVQLIIQYRIENPREFLFNVKDPEGAADGRTLRDTVEAALRQVVGQRSIDDVLTERKAEVQDATQLLLQRLLRDEYHTGIQVVNVKLQDVQPPQPVQDAFKDVIAAREDEERVVNEAKAYESDIIPKARGELQRVVLAAEAFQQARIEQARGEADRFTSILAEYRQAQDVTRRRLYLETMEKVLATLKKIIVTPEVARSLLPFLPLQTLSGENSSAEPR